MGYIIVSMPKQENAVKIKELIKAGGFWEDIIICRKGSEVLALVNEQDVRLVVCMRKFVDMGYEELVSFLPGHIPVLLLTQDDALVPFTPAVTKLLMPFKAESFVETLKMVLGIEVKPKKKKFRTREDQEAIDQAKQQLMKQHEMTEPEAYRYLQKISMDTQRSLVETAKMIIVFSK